MVYILIHFTIFFYKHYFGFLCYKSDGLFTTMSAHLVEPFSLANLRARKLMYF